MPFIFDNPAARLLAILEAGLQIKNDTQCRAAWQTLLDAEGNEALLMSRLGKVMELPQQIIIAAAEHFPSASATWVHWSTQVNAGFMTQSLNGQWQSFIGHIDAHSINYLGLTSALLSQVTTVKPLMEENIESLLHTITEVLSEVVNAADLGRDVKLFVVRYLEKIIICLHEYRITGVLPILDAVDAAVGHTAVDPDYKNFMATTELGDRVAKALEVVANVVTIAVGLPALGTTIGASWKLLGLG